MLFSIYIVQIVYLSFELECEKNENIQKEAGIGPFKKKTITRKVVVIKYVPMEIKLATDFGVGAASVGHVIAVERHHMGQHVGRVVMIWN